MLLKQLGKKHSPPWGVLFLDDGSKARETHVLTYSSSKFNKANRNKTSKTKR